MTKVLSEEDVSNLFGEFLTATGIEFDDYTTDKLGDAFQEVVVPKLTPTE